MRRTQCKFCNISFTYEVKDIMRYPTKQRGLYLICPVCKRELDYCEAKKIVGAMSKEIREEVEYLEGLDGRSKTISPEEFEYLTENGAANLPLMLTLFDFYKAKYHTSISDGGLIGLVREYRGNPEWKTSMKNFLLAQDISNEIDRMYKTRKRGNASV